MAHGLSDPEHRKEHFDSDTELDKKLDELAEWVKASKHFIAFTGAGISTSTGIPDFRSGMDTVLETGPGAWELRDHKASHPKNAKILNDMQKAIPSPAHMALVELQRRGILKMVVSQNCDGLHLRSGLNPAGLAELHGNMNLEICSKCGARYLRDYDAAAGRLDHYTGRKCDRPGCGEALKDSIINFGENLPREEINKAFRNAEQADVCLVLGSSLTVTPAANVPSKVAERRQKLIIGNLQRTPLHSYATLNIHAFSDTIMKGLMERLNIPIPPWIVRRRIHVQIRACTTIKSECYKISVESLDPDQDLPYSLFKNIVVSDPTTKNRLFILNKEPFMFTIDVLDDKQQQKIQMQLNFFGHYNELPYTLEYTLEGKDEMFFLFYNPMTGQWKQTARADDLPH